MTTLPFDYIAIWPADDEGAGYRRRLVIEGKGLLKTQLADAVPTGQSMLQLQVSSSCARRFQAIARPFREAVQSSQAARFARFLSCGFDQRLSTILPVFRGFQALPLCLETDEAMEYGAAEFLTKSFDFESLKAQLGR